MKHPEDYLLDKMGKTFETTDVYHFYEQKGINISVRTIHNYLKNLQKDHKIQKIKNGSYMKLLQYNNS